jgi:hypothetical protein
MQRPAKAQFLKGYGFPPEWEAWDLYPDELFEGQLAATDDDEEPHPDEHLRYGAFCWWVRRHRDLSEETLIQLCRLAALDPDPPMAGAAVHDILFHPKATVRVAAAVAEVAQGHEGWSSWFAEVDKYKLFIEMFDKGRLFWSERNSAHRVAIDLYERQLGEPDLRELYATGSALVLRGLVEHPKLPNDILVHLSEQRSGRFAKGIRSIAMRRLAGKPVAPTNYAERYSTDPWSWPW